ncbi:hypothetical protein CFP56_008340 [Quercus suber]|uniref:Uncharacterized protein n=1 Tax=Quercus suber TaxID=58331 RepID=A0AAW0L3L1_QUESU
MTTCVYQLTIANSSGSATHETLLFKGQYISQLLTGATYITEDLLQPAWFKECTFLNVIASRIAMDLKLLLYLGGTASISN